jgi:DNA-binding response OmpR family regulator
MKALVAAADRVSRRMLEAVLTEWGEEVVTACDGTAALEVLQAPDAPPLAVLDWVMPGLDGLEVCRRARALANPVPPYLILLTVRDSRQDLIRGLRGGADDYMPKPFDLQELHARLEVGRRFIALQRALADRVQELEDALAHIKQLQDLLPMCIYCKSVRHVENYWQRVDDYLADHADIRFSHGICPHCYEKLLDPGPGAPG